MTNVNFAIVIESLLYVYCKLFNPAIELFIEFFKLIAIHLHLYNNKYNEQRNS